jgi:hypothetical protein
VGQRRCINEPIEPVGKHSLRLNRAAARAAQQLLCRRLFQRIRVFDPQKPAAGMAFGQSRGGPPSAWIQRLPPASSLAAAAEAIPRVGPSRPNPCKQAQINENKRKQNCFLLLSFTYVYFFESGLFNGLRPIQTNKSFPVSAPAQHVPERTSVSFSRGQTLTTTGFDPVSQNYIAQNSVFR